MNSYINEPNHNNEIELRYRFVSPCSKLIRRSLIDNWNIVFDETIVSNDVMFSTKAGFFAKKIECSDKCIYCITKKDGTLTTQKNIDYIFVRQEVSINVDSFLKKHLSKNDYAIVHLRGIDMVYAKYKEGYGVKVCLELVKRFRKANIQVLDLKAFKDAIRSCGI